MNPVAFFETHHPHPGEISKRLQELPESLQVAWEEVSVHPKFSPGPVAANESVCRPFTSPTHYEAGKQELKPTAFEDASSFGMSVDRMLHTTLEASIEKAKARVANANAKRAEGAPEKVVFGYSVFDVDALRRVMVKAEGSKDPARRGVGIYDTSLDGEPEHADICVIAPKSQGARSARAELFKLANLSHKPLAS